MFKIYFYVKTHKHIHKEAKLTIYSQHNDKSLSCNFSDTSCAELDIIPQHGEGESHKKAKGSAKVRDEGLKRIDEVLEDIHVEMNLKLIMVVDQPEVDLVCFLRVGCNTLLGFEPLSF